ncbi:guanitoxin biosynthesis heme-dependent pre-guanitoxin N-hydroxylase GntA [Streptomyces erythrochromogenes]|uniref:guanitoxin biosynthesis heme-dependent pre-guanitoxin N-hydroxylase GntA n=1 Tax=Streptomyces erythrochromogenes TaxID=285574 RepID=UPI00362A159C
MPIDDDQTETRFRELLLGGSYPCLGGVGAVRRGDYRLHRHPPLGSAAAVAQCTANLTDLLRDFPVEACPVAVMVAVFDGPADLDEAAFETLMWTQLDGMRQTAGPPLPDLAGRDDNDPAFGFGDRDFFVVGLGPSASRHARMFLWPTLVFNALTHSVQLHSEGRHNRMRDRIRARDIRLQGNLNPNLARSSLAQFSGRDVGDNWSCPAGFAGSAPERRTP